MKYKKLRDKYAIVRVGYTPQGKIPNRTAINFHVETAENAASGKRMFIEEVTHSESFRDNAIYGEFGFIGDYATAAKRAMFEFKTGPNTWKHIATNQRKCANFNPLVQLHNETLNEEIYLNFPILTYPFRKFDAALISDGGRAVQ